MGTPKLPEDVMAVVRGALKELRQWPGGEEAANAAERALAGRSASGFKGLPELQEAQDACQPLAVKLVEAGWRKEMLAVSRWIVQEYGPEALASAVSPAKKGQGERLEAGSKGLVPVGFGVEGNGYPEP
mmetsp:Transcript_52430/g.166763  ORF Transcript_52430/g.166763 Transcript_52430/m.166763 type:complete len:129 (-) Transcript_52430:157-543(-)